MLIYKLVSSSDFKSLMATQPSPLLREPGEWFSTVGFQWFLRIYS